MNSHQRRKFKRSQKFNETCCSPDSWSEEVWESLKLAVQSPHASIPDGLSIEGIKNWFMTYDGPWFDNDGFEVINIDNKWVRK